jgi:hypothetical protein
MNRKNLGVNHGGLFRCCLQSIAEWVNEDPDAVIFEGTKIRCKYEANKPENIIIKDGVAQWVGIGNSQWQPTKNDPRL